MKILTDVSLEHISLVDEGANNRKFIFYKGQNMDEQMFNSLSAEAVVAIKESFKMIESYANELTSEQLVKIFGGLGLSMKQKEEKGELMEPEKNAELQKALEQLQKSAEEIQQVKQELEKERELRKHELYLAKAKDLPMVGLELEEIANFLRVLDALKAEEAAKVVKSIKKSLQAEKVDPLLQTHSEVKKSVVVNVENDLESLTKAIQESEKLSYNAAFLKAVQQLEEKK